jgi:hypothetical protein
VPCKRYVYERYRRMNYRTIPATEISTPVRYRDVHDLSCAGDCQPEELPWPDGEPWQPRVQYRLLRRGEPIQRGDQPLDDDCETWGELAGWEVGMEYNPGVLKPIRRRVES